MPEDKRPTLRIQRSRWARGVRLPDGRVQPNWKNTGLGASLNRIVNLDGKRSCFGFMLEAFANLPEAKLQEQGYPYALGIGLNHRLPGAPERIPASYPPQVEILRINNREGAYRLLSDEEQERLLAEKLVEHFGGELGFDAVAFSD